MNSSQPTDSQQVGRELSQIARLLFDKAANRWYGAIALEIVAGSIGVVLSVVGPSGKIGLALVIVGALPLVLAYVLRLLSEDQYDIAETMRRQSVFAEALNWTVSPWQMAEWRRKAGKQVRNLAQKIPRPEDYYATTADIGPMKLAEMINESAFYTYNLYCTIRSWIAWILLAMITLSAIGLAITGLASEDIDIVVSHILYAMIPIVVAVDLFGWWLRLGRTVAGLAGVQRGLENIKSSGGVDTEQVLRIVTEYNNHVSHGIPIHNWLFERLHGDIDELWAHRISSY